MSRHDGRSARHVDLRDAHWRKSRRSSGNGACVEVAFVEGVVAVRDSKETGGPALVFSAAGWTAFLDGACPGCRGRP
ncbi:DUF397 domain-containing protein [Streptomyces sp. NPDC060027]|uniref:DUF397 domain-containing protein n=1 Tax=Streptomyces sp. NPDC060027 TaxID=3347040 RepID=UPI0036A7604A